MLWRQVLSPLSAGTELPVCQSDCAGSDARMRSTHLEQRLHEVVVGDATLATGVLHQVTRPHERNPPLPVRCRHLVQRLQLVLRHHS